MNKEDIKSAIQRFSQGSLTEKALNLFKTLGYNTDRQAPLDRPDYATFKENYINPSSRFDEKKALVSDWQHIDLLFQLSKEEVLKQTSLFDTRRVDNAVIESYLFFAVELSKPHYNFQLGILQIKNRSLKLLTKSLPPNRKTRRPIPQPLKSR